MSEPQTTRWVTAEELAAMPDDGVRRELVEGRVVEMPPAGWEHGEIATCINAHLLVFVRQHHLGRIAGNDPGVVLSRHPDEVRAPDGAFYAGSRLAGREQRYPSEAPNLVLEVVSPTDRAGAVVAKAGRWLDAGAEVVWVVWPDKQRVTVFSQEGDPLVLSRDDTLTCEELLPGFALPLTDVFVDWEQPIEGP